MRLTSFPYILQYIVEPDDNLTALARRYRSSPCEIADVNGLKDLRLTPGQRLNIPLEHGYYHHYHTVISESIGDIASRYHTDAEEIIKDNLVTSPSPEESLVIHQVYIHLFFVSDYCTVGEEIKKIDYPIDDIRKVALRELFLKLSEFTGQTVYLRRFCQEGSLATIDIGNLRMAAGSGAQTEELLLESILQTLSSYKEIKYADILLDGHRCETINGHILLCNPLPVPAAG